MTLNQAAWLALGLAASMLVYTLAVFVRGGLPRRIALTVGSIGAVWLVLLRASFSQGEPFPEDISGLWFFILILVGVGVFGAALFGHPALRDPLVRMDQTWLLAPQAIRIVFGATFLLWASEDILPRTFGIVDGLTHITAGVLGLGASIAMYRNHNMTLPWVANIFGLGDILIVASSIAFVLLDDIGPHHPMMYAVFAPAPVWLWLHVVSIYRLSLGAEVPDHTRNPDVHTDGARQSG